RLSNRFKLKCYGKGDCETTARIKHGGANGCRTGDTLAYWNRVKERCTNCR
uniref:lysozyme n=1 Tax=Plectus sambesii TaxID=2011161 RepID=A0A914UWQ5_9BILA